MTEAEKIAKQLQLQPHPEGGYFKETYRSQGSINQSDLSDDISGNRNYSTAIYFLLTSDSFSAFHRIKQDEIWHFYKGNPIKLHVISAEGVYTNVIIGNNLGNGELPQYVVNAKDWFAAEVIGANTFSLLGCTVSPGFDFKDFELAERNELTSTFPQHSTIIKKLTR
jgi:predicted cupin superfamily sugar epimerase